MKKTLFFIAIACTSLLVSAQSVPNGNFETWTPYSYSIPQNFIECSNPEAHYKCNAAPNEVKSTDPYHGSYALQLTTVTGGNDTAFGYIVNAITRNGNPAAWKGGFAYSQKPTGIRGYYKSAIVAPDSARILAVFKKAGTSVGQYVFSFYGNQSAYTLFSFPFVPALSATPDTVILAFASSDFVNKGVPRPGSMIQLDSISFTGVTSQPASFNGDFENWKDSTIEDPANWFIGSGQGDGVKKTSDAAAGNYAAELTTYLGDYNGKPAASSGNLSSGFCSGNNTCVWKGGYPFSNQIDTLIFSYKYAPKGNDSAQVSLNFKKNGSQFSSTGRNLGPSATYKTYKIGFNLNQTPDTVIIQISSSVWPDTALSFVGSDLKIDEIHFKTQPLNTSVPTLVVENNLAVYPNPTSGEFTVQSTLFDIQNIEVFNAVGEKVLSKNANARYATLNLSDNGIYLVRLNSNGKTFTKRLIVNK